MVTVLSCDIGLLNLSFCIMQSNENKDISQFKILLWDVYDTLDIPTLLCQEIQKNKKICNKKASLKKETNYYCKKHFPKDVSIQKKNKYSKKKISSFSLQDIGTTFLNKVQTIYSENQDIFEKVDSIHIELQPKVARKMIFVSHILYGKFIDLYKGTSVPIKFVRASQKLKAYTGPEINCHLKTPYARRKWLSVEYTKWFLENKFSKEQKELWLPKLLNNKKGDDVGDTFTMSINAIIGVPKTKQKNGDDIK